jgi:heat shock protein HslJ
MWLQLGAQPVREAGVAGAGERVGYRDATFSIDGREMRLGESDALQYFGNELITDLTGDGRDDVVFLVTHTPGGSGTFYYVVAAIQTEARYVGSDGYLLGDRIAPQTTVASQDERQVGVVVVNYADRALDEAMIVQPSIGRSVYLKIDPIALRWGVVEPDFPGEADPALLSLTMKPWVWQRVQYGDGRLVEPKDPAAFTLTMMEDGSFSATTDCNQVGGRYAISDDAITFSDVFSTKMYCEGSQEADFTSVLTAATAYSFTSRGELVLELSSVDDVATFR